jgi:hypothetical protein
MKKYSILFAVVALVLASLACQTITGGGNSPVLPDVPNSTNVPTAPDITNPEPTKIPDNGGNNGRNVQFPTTSDAFNITTTANAVTYQTKMSADNVAKFYRDEFATKGYTEDTSMAITFGKNFTLGFTDGSGKAIVVAGVDAGDGSLYITITSQ